MTGKQEREFQRVGGNETLKADVRIAAATNRNLESSIAKSGLREDLYYRLNVFPIEVPPFAPAERKAFSFSWNTLSIAMPAKRERKSPALIREASNS